jgi:hypothetical protein
MDAAAVKRNLRELRRLEKKIRYGKDSSNRPPLVWDSFFDLRGTGAGKGKYSLEALAAMSRADYKKAIGEYWSFVFGALYSENDASAAGFDAGILLRWGLPSDADAAAVKQRFRTFAKLYHPDTGGDADAFIGMMQDYRKLMGK